jgi:CheY-like chemotaxis protein
MNMQMTGLERPGAQANAKVRPTLVVVDDDDDIREALSTLLQVEGHTVRGAADGVEGLCVISELEQTPCIVLLDMMMPEMSGAEVMLVLREANKLPELPVVVISATTPTASDVAGARLCLHKPLDVETTLTVVRRLCAAFE